MGQNHPSIQQAVAGLPKELRSVCQNISDAGGKAWLVGGCVRDLMLGIAAKDFDLEVYHLSSEALEALLSPLGRCQHVGKQFGVLKFWHQGLELDIALPRQERKTAAGHKGFEVTTHPDLDPETASLRRDFTINAMMLDPLSTQLLDLHHGRQDLNKGILRHVSTAFAEDPLRPLRAMQFAARFKLTLADETSVLCRQMLGDASSLSPPRIWIEWQKWSHAEYPSFGLEALQDSGWLSLYPEIKCLINCPQDAQWHPEGNVWQHTLQVVDQAAAIATRNKLDDEQREYLVFAALCHDFGKPETNIEFENGRIGSPGHSSAGSEISRHFLRRIHAPKRIADYVTPLIKDHMCHMHGEPTPRAVGRLAHRLKPAHIELWEMLVEADASGRAPAPPSRPALCWLRMAEDMAQHRNAPVQILTAQMLMDMGVTAGPKMGKILKNAYSAQLDGDITDERSALAWCKKKNNLA